MATSNKKSDFETKNGEPNKRRRSVQGWRTKINKARSLLELHSRAEEADKGDKYLNGTMDGTRGHKIYVNHGLPMLEELSRETLPAIPEPVVEAYTEAGEIYEGAAKAILSVAMSNDRLRRVLKQLQWDDYRSGMAVCKTDWLVEYVNNEGNDSSASVEQQALEVEHAEAENVDILSAGIAESDVDSIHIAIHQQLEALDALDATSSAALTVHIEDHEARAAVIKRECPVLRRVPWTRFVWDCEVDWSKRGWEAERKTEKIQDMLDWGWKNINVENISENTQRGGDDDIAYKSADVWHVHDRMTNRYIVVSADGPSNGLPLFESTWIYGNIDVYLPIITREWKAEQPWGASTVSMMLPILDRLAEINFHIDRHVRTHADYKVIKPEGAGGSKFKSGMNNPDQRFVDASPEVIAGWREYKPPPIPAPLLEQQHKLMDALKDIIGLSAQDTGSAFPHRISATESSERGETRDKRADDRQGIFAELLSRIAHNYLGLYRKFGTQKVSVRQISPEGASYEAVEPASLPAELLTSLDVKGETNSGRALRVQQAFQYVEFLKGSEMSVDWNDLNMTIGRLCGFKNPSRFILDELPQDTENVQASQGQGVLPMSSRRRETSDGRPDQTKGRAEWENTTRSATAS